MFDDEPQFQELTAEPMRFPPAFRFSIEWGDLTIVAELPLGTGVGELAHAADWVSVAAERLRYPQPTGEPVETEGARV